MIKLPQLSLFARLYLNIAVAVIISATITFLIIDEMLEQNEIDEFVLYSDYIYSDLLDNGELSPLVRQKSSQPKKLIELLSVSWQLIPMDQRACNKCAFIGRSKNVDVYLNKYDQFIAVYTLSRLDAWLVIMEEHTVIQSDGTGLEIAKDLPIRNSRPDVDDVAPFIILFIILLTIASCIYWPIRRLQKQISRLITLQHSFGAGEMKVRVEEKLSEPLNELANSFNTMATQISNTVEENQIFAQAVPHEIRTPLSRIQLATGLIRHGELSQQQIELLGNIDTYIDDVDDLIGQVVSFTKLNSSEGKSEFDLYLPIELSDFIDSRIKASSCSDKLNIHCDIDSSLSLTTNPAYLRLLLDNLLKNANCYAKSDLFISLKLVDHCIELTIEDDGEGIPEEAFETIFLPFSRLDASRSRKTGGLGLGLAITKSSAKRMNAQLSVQNNQLGGAKFTCRFLSKC